MIRVIFSDGLVRELDFAACRDGLFASLADDAVFDAVQVDQVVGTVSFPGGIDVDPDVLHGDAAVRAAVQLVTAPSHWEKTTHGLTLGHTHLPPTVADQHPTFTQA